MGKSDPPPPPDPRETAAAQTAQNVGTAIANNTMQMVDQVTPYGTLTYEQTGTYEWDDPNTGGAPQFGYYSAPPQATEAAEPNPFLNEAGQDSRDPFATSSERAGTSSVGGWAGGYVPGFGGPRQTYEIPRYTATVTLPEDQQAALDAQFASNRALSEAALERSQFLKGYLPDGLDVSGLPELRDSSFVGGLGLNETYDRGGDITRTYGTDFSEDRQRVEDALMARMEPYLAQSRDRLRTDLANRGINSGSEAYGYEQTYQSQRENDARMAAILSAGEEQSRLTGLERDRAYFENQAQAQAYGQNAQLAAFENATQESLFNSRMALAGLDNAARTQDLNERFALRNQPINEIAALLANSQVQDPGLQPIVPGAIPTTDYAGIVSDNYASQVSAYNAQTAAGARNFATGAGLIGGIISDRRLKKNVLRVGEAEGLGIYEYNYIWGGPTHRGYMAQEVLEKRPEAVIPMGEFMALDYAKLPEIPQCV